MSSISQTTTRPPERSASVAMGKQSFIAVVLRSIWAELYRIRRRTMTKVLLIIAIPILILAFAFISIPTIVALNTSASSYLIPCSLRAQFSGQNATRLSKSPCKQGDTPTQDELNQAEQYRQNQIETSSAALRLPGSITASGSIIDFIGLIVLIILVATIVGGEYGIGTIRLMLSRGPTRTQYLLAKMGAILVCIVVTVVVLTIIGIITGALLNLMTGIGLTNFFTGTWVLHLLLYLLALICGLFVWTMLALTIATLGRATAGGLAGGLVWWFLEGVLGTILVLTGGLSNNWFGDMLKAIPDYFIGNNVAALLDNQRQYLSNGPASSLSDLHAVLVLLGYLVVLVGLSWWLLHKRDVTN